MRPTEVCAKHRLIMDSLEERIGGHDCPKTSQRLREERKIQSTFKNLQYLKVLMSPTECQYKALKGLIKADNWGHDCINY